VDLCSGVSGSLRGVHRLLSELWHESYCSDRRRPQREGKQVAGGFSRRVRVERKGKG